MTALNSRKVFGGDKDRGGGYHEGRKQPPRRLNGRVDFREAGRGYR